MLGPAAQAAGHDLDLAGFREELRHSNDPARRYTVNVQQGAVVLTFVQMATALGRTDVHPGGAAASERLLGWLAGRGVESVLEVGAGAGGTTRRLLARGFAVTALEPDRLVFPSLKRVAGQGAQNLGLLEYRARAPHHAAIAESVLYLLDLPQALLHLSSLLAPGGLLALVDAVWTEQVDAREAAEAHDRTRADFGIAVASRQRWLWRDWLAMLGEAGFTTLEAVRLPEGSAGARPSGSRARALGRALLRPSLLPDLVRQRLAMRRSRLPPGALESWMWLGQRGWDRPMTLEGARRES